MERWSGGGRGMGCHWGGGSIEVGFGGGYLLVSVVVLLGS